MALEGSLTDFGLADILQLIYFQRKTGILALEGRMDSVKLLFVEGNITGAESRRRNEDNRLGKILIKKGLIGEEDLRTALEEHRKTGNGLGKVLAAKRLVEKETIIEIIKGQITETVIQLFGWKQGAYEFTSQGVPVDREFSFSVDTQHLLMEGLRILDEWSVIKGKISIYTVFRKRSAEKAGLTDEEEEMLQYVDGENDVSTIIDLTSHDSFNVCRILLGLAEKGLIDAVESAPVAAGVEPVRKRKALPFLNYLVPGAIVLSLVLAFSVVLVNRGNYFRKLRAAGQVSELRARIDAYRVATGVYPDSLEGMSHTVDPWGRRLVYRASGSSYALCSSGADGMEGTPDDVY
ncbi:MAG: DUF4388 domain-containing protein [Candidatus Sulfobium sp.]